MSPTDFAGKGVEGQGSSFFSVGARQDDSGPSAARYPAHGPTASLAEQLSLVMDASGAIGWWDWDVQNDRLYAGRQFADIYGVDPDDAERGEHLSSFMEGVDPRDRERVSEAVQQAVDRCGSFLEDYRIKRHDGDHKRPLWVTASGRCYGDDHGKAVRFPGVILDITARKTSDMRKRALIELGDKLRDLPDMESIVRAATDIVADVLSPSRVGFGMVNNLEETVAIPDEWRRDGVLTIAGIHHFRSYGSFIDDLKAGRTVFIEDVEDDPRTAGARQALLDIGINVLLNVPIVEHGKLVLVMFAHNDGPVDWDQNDLNFAHAVADRVQVTLARQRAETQRELLNRELSHRLKNSLAMAQSIVSQSLRSATDLKSAKDDIGRRLSALGRAHEVLLRTSSERADIATVVSNALRPYQDSDSRLHCRGPGIALSAPAALSLSLILHELATNAVKYGALSSADGHVELSWTVEDGGPGRMTLQWKERGGPPIAPPSREGFGSRLIRYGITGATDQSVSTDYAREGLTCELSVALSDIVANSSDELLAVGQDRTLSST
ncbi:sensor histidine kinase [Notoacmeibacter sp. MSK16QG-6]|uniref:sensor histidine kinase n=1 Tax=Notoacmeibacter sp. MSK16QG-6 TaxID=2957982 RepID=UPI00209CD8FB|nr:HWE histidine kinase domain-containing protein [Notoacmeibacter sp. MSK16QG-6]MCP1198980.1 PAS domain-containing protein [Notoacmeibacter sp. MSK16QG-6]